MFRNATRAGLELINLAANKANVMISLNRLIYEHRVRLSRNENWQRMQTLLRYRDEIYHQMTDQLYWLGQVADRNFRLLDVPRKVFRRGLRLSVLWPSSA